MEWYGLIGADAYQMQVDCLPVASKDEPEPEPSGGCGGQAWVVLLPMLGMRRRNSDKQGRK